MSYAIKELYYTLQGEGANAGRAAVFLRFAGCNLWSGREEDRAKAVCTFCDTDFIGIDGPGGGRFSRADEIATAVRCQWPASFGSSSRPLVVCTGGEPLLQLDDSVVTALHNIGFEVAVETNGTQLPPPGVDWVFVSPKAGSSLKLRHGNELKLVYPQPAAPPERYASLGFDHFFLQPMDGPRLSENVASAVEYCLANPQWRLSLQTHKLLGIA
jgi:7-carboxy-7-deazaguanine synthase (Cx14CxxC type)